MACRHGNFLGFPGPGERRFFLCQCTLLKPRRIETLTRAANGGNRQCCRLFDALDLYCSKSTIKSRENARCWGSSEARPHILASHHRLSDRPLEPGFCILFTLEFSSTISSYVTPQENYACCRKTNSSAHIHHNSNTHTQHHT